MKTHDYCYYANKIMAICDKVKQPLQQEEAIMEVLAEMTEKHYTSWWRKLWS